MKVSKDALRHLFVHYSYGINLLHGFMDLSPPVIKWLLLKLLLKRMGSKVFIEGRVYFRYPNRVSIGSRVSINRGCEFYPSLYHKDAEIVIGNNIRFGPNVRCLAAGHDHQYLHLPDTAGRIEIQDNTWIGGNVVILPGVTIAEGTVVGAGAVVTKDTTPYSIYAGIPAKFIKSRNVHDDQDKIQ